MPLTQNWVSYLDRSYEQIKRSLLKRLGIQNPEITDHTENNVLIIIISMFSGVAEMLGLYIDRSARESFIGTAKKYDSVVRLSKLMDYQIKARNPSSVDLQFSLIDNSNNPTTLANPYTIPANFIVRSKNSLDYLTFQDATIKAGISSIFVKAVQHQASNGVFIGMTSGSQSQRFQLADGYENNTMVLSVEGVEYTSYNSFGLMFPNTLGYVINIEEDSKAYLKFGDGTNGTIPQSGYAIYADFYTTEGELGNAAPNTIETIQSSIPTLPDGVRLIVTNPDYASGGRPFETIEEIRERAPRALRVNNRTVTYQDYLDDPLLVPGIAASAVHYCCGKFIDVYIIPTGKGMATNFQIQQVQNYLDKRKMIGTFPAVQAAGITLIWLKGTIYGKPLIPKVKIQLQVAAALDAEYGYPKIKINRRISASDIIALIEGLSTVDRFELQQVRIKPYARAVEKTQNLLNLEFLALPKTIDKTIFRIIYNGTDFELYKNAEFLQMLNIDDTYTEEAISFAIRDGTYTNGDTWEFTVMPSYPEIFPITLINITDFSAPIIQVDDFIDDQTERPIYSNLEIITQNFIAEELPPCED